jgi:hypothetical protein
LAVDWILQWSKIINLLFLYEINISFQLKSLTGKWRSIESSSRLSASRPVLQIWGEEAKIHH